MTEEWSPTPIEDAWDEMDGNGHSTAVNEEEDEILARTIITKEDIEFAINTIIKEARYDELSIRQILHGFNSSFTKTPIPHVINSKNSGAGKSYLLNHVASFYPDKNILTLAGISDKAIFHSDGPMVIEDEQTGEIRPIDPTINDLEAEINELEREPKKNKQEIKETRSEIKSLQRSAQKLIDLTNKIIIIQDTPSSSVFNLIMTLLSQDTPKDQIYAFTDKSGNGKLIQSRNRIRGMPVIFTTQVIDDTDNQRFEEKNRRFIHVTPNTSREKIREANRLTATKYGSIAEEYDILVVSREDIARAKQIIRVIIAKLKVHSKYLGPKQTGVKIPFAMTVTGSLPNDGNVWNMTVAERVMKYLSMNTKLHMDQRPRLVHKETGAFYPITTFEDLKDTMQLMERAATNIRPYLSEWYERVFLPAFQGLDGKPNVYENDVGMPLKENYVGLITEQLAAKTQEVMHVHKPSTDDIRKSYLYPLINLGLVDKAPSVKDHRHNIFYPVETGNITGSNKNKILVSDPNLYPTKNIIEESFRTIVKYDAEGSTFFDQTTDYRIEDVDGRKIELEELIDRHFSNPEEYFEKGYSE
jgi:CBS domain-containing protein